MFCITAPAIATQKAICSLPSFVQMEFQTGLCYQRLAVGEQGPPYCLHGLNAAFFEDHGWYRFDARGNKTGIQASSRPRVSVLHFQLLAMEKPIFQRFGQSRCQLW